SVVQAVTDGNGQALALLSNGSDISNRPITVTASVGGITNSVVVNVLGTRLRLTPPSASLSVSDSANFTAVLEDSAATGISGETLTVESELGNTLTASS